MNFKNGKPIVRFSNPTHIELGESAEVYTLDHPRLGAEYVITSEVLQIFATPTGVKAFETRNTNYVLDSYKIPE